MAIAVFAFPAFASTTDGTIDSTNKYAWGENIGWVNFGASNGNVHVTDSALSGYALSETVGWINLSNVLNDGAGNLSGYGWSENTGWIKFNPASGGVIINSSGEFTGSALSETVGWIIFGGDYKVKTDWRPQSARGSGGGLPPAAYNPPVPPSASSTNPEAGFKISINQGVEYTNSFTVNLSLVAGSDTVRMAISESPDFKNASQIPYQQEIKYELLPIPGNQIPKQGIRRTIYAKFYTQYGVSSEIVSASIILVTSLPQTQPSPFTPSGVEGALSASPKPARIPSASISPAPFAFSYPASIF